MDNLSAQRIVEMQGRRGLARVNDLPSNLRVDDKPLLGGRAENGDVVSIKYIATSEHSGVFGVFGVFVEGVLVAQVPELMSFFVPKYVFAENTEAALATLLVQADIPFTLVKLRG